MTETMQIALLILRLVAGLTMAAHGSQKLFGWFGGGGLRGTQAFFASQGFYPTWIWLALAIIGEFGGGLSLASGLLTPLGAAGVFGAMVMATFKTHWKNGFFSQKGGFEYSFLLMFISIFFGLFGPGKYSLDALLGYPLPQAPLFLVLAAAALVTVLIGIQVSNAHQKQAA